MTVFRCFVEKKKPFAVEANGVRNELTKTLLLSGVEDVRVINRYDIENIDEEDWNNAVRNILSEPQVDDVYEETAPAASENECGVSAVHSGLRNGNQPDSQGVRSGP